MRRSQSKTTVADSSAARVLYKHPGSKFISWPEDWTVRHYNGGSEPCDMLIGFCSCGAAHHEREEWVQAALGHYNCIIRDYLDNPTRTIMLETLGVEEVEFLERQERQQRELMTLSYF